MNWWRFAPKPGVFEQRQRAAREAERLAKRLGKSGRKPSPVRIEGRAIARSFWGKAWCENLESYRDYEYRLPRGRSYLRNGAVLDLNVASASITAVVAGSRPTPYDVDIKIKPVAPARWKQIKAQCAGEIGSLIELLEGRLSDRVMGIVTDRDQGLFPKPREIEMSCSCPDWATLCKHVAAVLYGVGARFDAQPELLFTLRKVDHGELIAQAADLEVSKRSTKRKTLTEADLGGVFGIELAETPSKRRTPATPRARPSQAKRPTRKLRAASTTTRRGKTKRRDR